MEPPYRIRRPLPAFVRRIPAGPVIAAVAILGFLLWSQQPDAARTVPDLVGRNIDDASATASEEGFATSVRERPGPGVAGTVVAQDPPASAVADGGTTIALEVTLGAPQIVVPQVAGMPVDRARDVLVETGFDVPEVTYRAYPEQEPGRVVGTLPGAGQRLDAGSVIELHAALP